MSILCLLPFTRSGFGGIAARPVVQEIRHETVAEREKFSGKHMAGPAWEDRWEQVSAPEKRGAQALSRSGE